jgi:anti-sigma B factor antagonist
MRLASLATARIGSVLVVTVTGEIDRSNGDELHQTILELVDADAGGLVIDLSPTRFLDSAGLDLLFDLQRRLRARGKQLSLCLEDGAMVRRTLNVAGADALIPCANDLATAVALTGASGTDQ